MYVRIEVYIRDRSTFERVDNNESLANILSLITDISFRRRSVELHIYAQ